MLSLPTIVPFFRPIYYIGKTMSISIRLALTTDAREIAKVHIASWQAAYRDYLSDETLDHLSLDEFTKQWRDWLHEGKLLWVAEQGGHIIGFCSLCATRDPDHNQNDVAEISTIYLLQAFWGKHIGKKLCQTALAYAKEQDFKHITLWVLEHNEPAQHFYKKMGFTQTRARKIVHIGTDVLHLIRYTIMNETH